MTEQQTLTLADFLLARIAEDEQWATAASSDEGRGATASGEHWRWECDKHDEPLVPNPSQDEFLCCPQSGWVSVSLRSVEQFPYWSIPGEGPHIHFSAEEVSPGTAGHIAHHDPARVLAECEAKRRIVAMHTVGHKPGDDRCWVCMTDCRIEYGEASPKFQPWPCATLRLVSLPYADHPHYREEWRV